MISDAINALIDDVNEYGTVERDEKMMKRKKTLLVQEAAGRIEAIRKVFKDRVAMNKNAPGGVRALNLGGDSSIQLLSYSIQDTSC